jgi:hypothetical protein
LYKRKCARTFKKGAVRATGVLKLIHSDICGSLNVKSVVDFDSFITFKDDFSRYGYIYLIRVQSEALEKFKMFNSGEEYCGRHAPYGKILGPFMKFLAENGIVAQYSMCSEALQNGVAEHQNCTLMDMV